MQQRLFYGWYVAIACGIGLGCGLASVITATFPIFLAPLRAEFGWSQPQVFGALALTTLTVTIAAPFFGALVDRIGARRMILAGLVLEALVVASFALQSASLSTFYLRYIGLALLALGTTHVAFTRVISLWFDRRRGLALGIMLGGLGVGSMVWPPLAQWMIDDYGWRQAYLVLAAIIAVVGFSAVALVVRDSPGSIGLCVDGVSGASMVGAPGATVPGGAQEKAMSGLTVRKAVRTPAFRLMLIAFILIGASISSVQVHLVPLLTSRGVSPMLAATALSILAAALVVGRLCAGWLMDRFFAPLVAIAFLAGPIVAVGMLAAGASGSLAFVAGILIGLAVGAEVDVTALLTSRYFGLRHFGGIYAFFYGAYTLGAAFGPLFTAIAVDKNGGYTEVLAVHGLLLVIGAILLARLPAFPRWP